MKPRMGAPITLTEEICEKVVEAIPRVLVLGQVAGLISVPRTTFITWLKKGDEDRLAGECSIYAHLSTKTRLTQAEECAKLLKRVKSSKGKNKSDSKWLLEKCFREDFGAESLQLNELTEMINKIKQDFALFKENQGRGIVNGFKMDSEGSEEERRAS